MRMKNLRKGLNSAIAIALAAGMTLSSASGTVFAAKAEDSSGGGAVYDAGYVFVGGEGAYIELLSVN